MKKYPEIQSPTNTFDPIVLHSTTIRLEIPELFDEPKTDCRRNFLLQGDPEPWLLGNVESFQSE
jgi:hypothetical protein